MLLAPASRGEQRFPPPEFTETNHQLPDTTTPAARSVALEYADLAVLLAALGTATWLVHRRRSRGGLIALSLFSIAWFGFYRKGCVCPIGAPQNVALALADPAYVLPLSVLVFFAAPLVFALFAGRAFCAGVCPHGALQDLVLVKPVKVPAWLEHALGVIPFVFLGAGVSFAATGTGFLICRYDPFVPLFRLNGAWWIVAAGVAFLVLGLFIGRPYCRFLCPYGALLRLASVVAKWRVRVTPDYCTQCRLCENACPFGVIREPALPAAKDATTTLAVDRRRLGWLLLALPALIALGAWTGSPLGVPAAKLHPTVALAERHLHQQKTPVQYGLMTPEALSLQRAVADPEKVLLAAAALRERFVRGAWWFGAWVGLVIGVKLIALSIRAQRTDWEPERGGCFACARCFLACPNERVRRGLLPASELPPMPNGSPAPAPVATKA